jgi:hypothetical protein
MGLYPSFHSRLPFEADNEILIPIPIPIHNHSPRPAQTAPENRQQRHNSWCGMHMDLPPLPRKSPFSRSLP